MKKEITVEKYRVLRHKHGWKFWIVDSKGEALYVTNDRYVADQKIQELNHGVPKLCPPPPIGWRLREHLPSLLQGDRGHPSLNNVKPKPIKKMKYKATYTYLPSSGCNLTVELKGKTLSLFIALATPKDDLSLFKNELLEALNRIWANNSQWVQSSIGFLHSKR